ncbi:DUF4406 domain-containing protein [Erwinia typographi]|uniref:DUF4406 domain-containing protein n=1 Tax=Erwinia typographi TaxID=371042 RepID=UPI0009077481|nr:DUF4406 domain-containing protein [Erwinia typographi]
MNTAIDRPAVVFISGPMTGIEDFNRPKFNREAQKLEAAGIVVLNPAILPDGLTHDQYMKLSLQMLATADVIYQLEGWSASKGAREEAVQARLLGLPFFSENLNAMGECAPHQLELPKKALAYRCGFCLRAVPAINGRMIIGQTSNICQGCVDLCNGVIADGDKKK